MWFIKDIGGIVCTLFYYILLLGISSIVLKISIIPLSSEGVLNEIGVITSYYFLVLLSILTHLFCMLTDPGSVPQIFITNMRTCYKCQRPKPSKVHHCSTCNSCILKMDHHCPWMNNCIGYFNQKHFILFLFYTELVCVYSITLLAIRAFYCQSDPDSNICDMPAQEKSVELMLGLISIMLLFLFTLFITIMIHDQLKNIKKNTTGIENLKKDLIVQRPVSENFSEVFGGKFGLRWFLPFKVNGSVEEYLKSFNTV
jgi:palmitoyltransferase ZDHHC3/7/25